jgi:hypothetical protein
MENSIQSCEDYDLEMECNMNDGCMWMNDHCMNSDDSCMDIEDEMICDMNQGCEWMMGMCMETMSSNNINTPHFIVMDENLGYWFVTTIASGYVAQYSLVDNQLIDSYFVGDAPAILTIDIERQKIYCSSMMPMNGMGDMMPSSSSNIIQVLEYSSMGLTESIVSEYEIDSVKPIEEYSNTCIILEDDDGIISPIPFIGIILEQYIFCLSISIVKIAGASPTKYESIS